MKRTSNICIAIATSFITVGCAVHPINSDKFISAGHMQGVTEPGNSYYTYGEAIKEISNPNPNKAKLASFVEQGSMLTYQNCISTVEGIANNSHQMSYAKDQFLIGSVLATGLLAVNGASSESFERLALGGSFLVSSLELYQNYYLMGPDAASVVDLVRNAMDAQLNFALEQQPNTFYEAAKIILDLSYVCSSVQINKMVVDSLRTANIKPPSQVLPQVLVQEQLEKILDEQIISDVEMAAMYEVMKVGQGGLEGSSWTATALSHIKDKVKNNFSEIRKILALQPHSFKEQIEAYIASMVEVSEPPASQRIDVQKRIVELKDGLSKQIRSDVDQTKLYLSFEVLSVLAKNGISFAEFKEKEVEPYKDLKEDQIEFLKSNESALKSWYDALSDEDILALEAKPSQGEAMFISIQEPAAGSLTPAKFDFNPVRTGRTIVTIERD